MSVDVPDKLLLQRIAQKDDQSAFRIIFDRYKDRVYAAALKMTRSRDTAEEIVQEVFVSLWLHRSSLGEIQKPVSYLFTTVYNTISRHFKKLAAEKNMKAQILEKSKKGERSTEQTIFEQETRQWLQNIINQLPTQQKLIYKLSKEDGLSRNEIAERLDISPNTVKNHLLKAMQFIKGHWGKVIMIIGWWLWN